MFVQIAEGLGTRSVLHTDDRSTRVQLASFGLRDEEGGIERIGRSEVARRARRAIAQ